MISLQCDRVLHFPPTGEHHCAPVGGGFGRREGRAGRGDGRPPPPHPLRKVSTQAQAARLRLCRKHLHGTLDGKVFWARALGVASRRRRRFEPVQESFCSIHVLWRSGPVHCRRLQLAADWVLVVAASIHSYCRYSGVTGIPNVGMTPHSDVHHSSTPAHQRATPSMACLPMSLIHAAAASGAGNGLPAPDSCRSPCRGSFLEAIPAGSMPMQPPDRGRLSFFTM